MEQLTEDLDNFILSDWIKYFSFAPGEEIRADHFLENRAYINQEEMK